MKAIRFLPLVAAIIVVSCSTAPAPRVITADQDAVSYTWVTANATILDITELARKHCAKFGRTARLAADNAGATHTTIFTCKVIDS